MGGFVIGIEPKGWRLREEQKGKGADGIWWDRAGARPGTDPTEMRKG